MQLSHKVATGISIEFGYLLLVSLQCPTASRIPPPNPTPPLLPCFLMGLSISRVWKCQTNDKVSQCQGQYSINVETFEDYAYAKLGFGNHKKKSKNPHSYDFIILIKPSLFYEQYVKDIQLEVEGSQFLRFYKQTLCL